MEKIDKEKFVQKILEIFPSMDVDLLEHDNNLCSIMMEVSSKFTRNLHNIDMIQKTLKLVELVANQDDDELRNNVMACFLEGVAYKSTWDPEIYNLIKDYMGEKTAEQWDMILSA